MNAYFGEDWDVPATEGQPHVDTPVGVPCGYCTIPIEGGDRGFMIGCVRLDAERQPYGSLEPWHRECLMRSTVGSVAHLDGRCTCHGGPGGEGPQTPAEVRAEAIEVWGRIASGRF